MHHVESVATTAKPVSIPSGQGPVRDLQAPAAPFFVTAQPFVPVHGGPGLCRVLAPVVLRFSKGFGLVSIGLGEGGLELKVCADMALAWNTCGLERLPLQPSFSTQILVMKTCCRT